MPLPLLGAGLATPVLRPGLAYRNALPVLAEGVKNLGYAGQGDMTLQVWTSAPCALVFGCSHRGVAERVPYCGDLADTYPWPLDPVREELRSYWGTHSILRSGKKGSPPGTRVAACHCGFPAGSLACSPGSVLGGWDLPGWLRKCCRCLLLAELWAGWGMLR